MYATPSSMRATAGITTTIEIAAVEVDLVDVRDIDAVCDGAEGAPIGKDGIDEPVGNIVEIVRVGHDVEIAELAWLVEVIR